MITQMEVFTAGVTAPPLPIVDQAAWKDAIQIKRIAGLGPVKADVNTSTYGSIDGSSLDGTYTPERNIVLTVKLDPDWSALQSYESLRQILYSYFMPENTVRLRFTSTHIAPVEITGVVETCEPDDLFSINPEYTISIICPQPYFTAVAQTSLQGLTQAFASPTDVLINYEGNSDAGFVLDISMPTGGTAFSGEARLINATPATKIAIISPIIASSASYFRYSGVQGSKYIRQYPLPTGLPSNALGKLQPGSSWITLRKGINKVQILTATAGLSWTMSYYARYGGL